MIRIACLIFLFLGYNSVFAGGDYVFGRVLSFSGDAGKYNFTFSQTNINRMPLIKACYEFKVIVNFENVPWYSWLPFIRSSHPTKEQTVIAASLLLDAFEKSQEIGFGYMGGGLIPTLEKCTFVSKGLTSEFDNVILSFNEPV
ncbi:hypothetical protein [Methylomonas sp. DH-1]|uniref:hypothetical protein n=1 Tax=Methylomonas sp. (strain DH-1) TaxID=1727196 RepID=UPI0007C9683A|nr:hypothetical protein [Methylomonas sp. DH-1]ANE54297.1 hypothetical protein AYM39_03235 [Methylomonas sp. DH-1]